MYIRYICLSEPFIVRIPREVKAKMRRYKNVNWSEVARKAILERLAVEEAREGMLRAYKEMDAIRMELLKSLGPTDYDSAEMIRYWRELRKQ